MIVNNGVLIFFEVCVKLCLAHIDKEQISYKYIEDIQMFGVNMTFISSSEVKRCIFHECRRHEGTNEIYIFSLHSMK